MVTTVPKRARIALAGAGAGTVLLAVVWYVSHYVAVARRADVSILQGFAGLERPDVDRVTNFIAQLCSPRPYVVLAVIPVLMALLRRRPQVAVMIALVLLCANETTQLLKPLLVAPRDPVPWSPIGQATWPSGHATASMTLALCVVIAAPARRRPFVAAAMAAFAIAVCYSFLELGWHYPSDVLGGFLVAATWVLLGIAGLTIYEARRTGVAGEVARTGPARVSIGQALTPTVALVGTALVGFLLIVIARPHEVIAYARAHEVFVLGACAIGVIGLLLASGLTLMLRAGQR